MLKFVKINQLYKMKKILPFLSLFVLLTAFTCENEPLDDGINVNDGASNNDNSLIGTWSAVSFTANTTSETTINGIENVVVSGFTGSNFNYNVTFTSSSFTTEGDYDVEFSTELNGVSSGTGTNSVNDINGSGTYSTNDNMMTIDGAFYDLEVDGVDTSALGGEQTVAYSISADGQTLTFTQEEVQTNNTGGFEVVTNISSSSVWQKN